MSKFEGVDFSRLHPQRLDPENPPVVSGFRPKRPEFSSHLKKRVLRDCTSHLAACWFLAHEDGFAAYITLMADRLSVTPPLLESEGVKYRTFPAIKIGLLAADARAKGAGTALLKWAFGYAVTEVSPRLGLRYITVDALFDPDTGYDAAPYYEKFGFIHADLDAPVTRDTPYRTMFFDLRPLILAVEN